MNGVIPRIPPTTVMIFKKLRRPGAGGFGGGLVNGALGCTTGGGFGAGFATGGAVF